MIDKYFITYLNTMCVYTTCHHGKRKNECKDCRGSGICEHGRRKSCCKDCGYSSICENNIVRYFCIDCNIIIKLFFRNKIMPDFYKYITHYMDIIYN